MTVSIPPDLRPVIEAALTWLPARMTSNEARVMLYAIGLQESRLRVRAQIVAGRPNAKGPARGLWQFEQLGGVRGVLTHPTTRGEARRTIDRFSLYPESRQVWLAIESNDELAAIFARLLLWTDPAPLPALGDRREAWEYYLRTWRPGKPKAATWDAYYNTSLEFVTSTQPETPTVPQPPFEPPAAIGRGNLPAFPAKHFDLAPGESGITIRELAALTLAQGLMARPGSLEMDLDASVDLCYRFADALLGRMK